MLASKNLPQPITNAADGHHWIRILAAELALRLNNARQTSPTLWPKAIVLHARKGKTKSSLVDLPPALTTLQDIRPPAQSRLLSLLHATSRWT